MKIKWLTVRGLRRSLITVYHFFAGLLNHLLFLCKDKEELKTSCLHAMWVWLVHILEHHWNDVRMGNSPAFSDKFCNFILRAIERHFIGAEDGWWNGFRYSIHNNCRLFVFVMETIISFLQCIYLWIWHAFGKNSLYLWTYCSRQHEWGFDTVFRWYNWNPTDVDELHPLFFWTYSTHHSADDSKVGFRWCYNNLNSFFIMKTILLQFRRRAKPIRLYRYEKTRRIIPTSLAPNVKQKYV